MLPIDLGAFPQAASLLLNCHQPAAGLLSRLNSTFFASLRFQGHVAGEADTAKDAGLLLPLWRVYCAHLGAVGTGVVSELSQAASDSTHAVNTHRYPSLLQHQKSMC